MSGDEITNRFDSFIPRTRCSREQKEKLVQLASARQLKPADILREALRDYLRRMEEQPELEAA